MSNFSSVSWRLNDLLVADKKAKEFATAGWNDPEQSAKVAPLFEEWSPTVVDLAELVDSEVLDAPDDALDDPMDAGEQAPEAPVEGVPANAEVVADSNAVLEEAQAAAVYAEEALQEAKREAHQEGYEKGRSESVAQYQKSKDELDRLVGSLRTAQSDMTAFYHPLKKLALHVAQQLVRGELSLSSSAVDRLIKSVLDDIEAQGEGPILIYLHPADRDNISDVIYDEFSNIDLRTDRSLSQGSVKISIDDTAIEDLMEQRLERLSEQILGFSAPMDTRETRQQFPKQVQERAVEGAVVSSDAAEVFEADEKSFDAVDLDAVEPDSDV